MALSSARLDRGLESLVRWRDAGTVFVPIRHHSPACSAALTALLEELHPTTVLIEGPREYTALAGVLADERTVPPIAVLSIAEGRSSCYPLADFSPEWVALRWGHTHRATVDFIDQSWHARDQDDDPGVGVRTLQAEGHLAQSQAIARLAAQLGCRDHDEVWEHLFELRTRAEFTDWRAFHGGVLAWAALARLEVEPEVLEADGTHAREAVMAAMISRHRAAATGPLVVVTGAFHTLALLEALDDTPQGRLVTGRDPGPLDIERPSWLIRYDHTRLDGLRGYGAGMPAPGFWQRAWAADPSRDGGRSLTVSVLLDVAERLRADGTLLSSADVTAASEQALRLAELRGRAWPGRTDVTDAMMSCFVADETGLSGSLGRAISEVFAGTTLGQLPPGLAAPPLVAEARAEAEKLRFVVSDAATRQVSLDTARKPRHVRRREFLATMRFVGSGFSRQLGGADLVCGTGLGQFVEEWEYAWTPLVEARLIEVSAHGATLAELRRARIAERLSDEQATAATVASLIAELVVMGASAELGPTLTRLGALFDTDASLASLVGALDSLLAMLTESGRLALADRVDDITHLLAAGLAAASYQLAPLAELTEEEAGPACANVLALHDVLRRLAEPDLEGQVSIEALRREEALLRNDRRAPAQLHGCLVALGHAQGDLSRTELHAEVAAHLHPGADPDRLASFLMGVMRATPDVILHDEDLLHTVSARLEDLEPHAFLRVLPDLRQAFTFLRPVETAALASRVASITGAAVTELDAVLRFTPDLVARALSAEQALVASLERDGLLSMVKPGTR